MYRGGSRYVGRVVCFARLVFCGFFRGWWRGRVGRRGFFRFLVFRLVLFGEVGEENRFVFRGVGLNWFVESFLEVRGGLIFDGFF